MRALVRRLLAGDLFSDPGSLRDWVARGLGALRAEVSNRAMRLMVPGALCGLAGALLGRRNQTMPAMRFACRLASAGLLGGLFLEARALAGGLMECASALANGIVPVMVSAAALAGQADASAFISPASALCAALLEDYLSGCGLALCGVLSAMAAAGNLSEGLRLDALFSLGRRVLLWGNALVLAAFMGVLSVQGLLAAGTEGFASRAVHLTLESLLPFIGSEVSDALGSLAVSASAVKNALGAAAMAVVVGACAKPLLCIAAAAIAARLAGALAGIAGDGAMGRMGEQFGEAIEMLLAVCVGGVLLVLLLAGGALSLGRPAQGALP